MSDPSSRAEALAVLESSPLTASASLSYPLLQIEAAEDEIDLKKPPAQDVSPENSPENGSGNPESLFETQIDAFLHGTGNSLAPEKYFPCAVFPTPGGASQNSFRPPPAVDTEPPEEEQPVLELGGAVAAQLRAEQWATVMLRNLPSHLSTEQMLEGLKTLGFGDSVDFCFVAVNTDSNKCRGYAFINLDSVDAAARFAEAVDGYSFAKGRKRTVVSVAQTQGVMATLQRMRPWKRKSAAKFEAAGRPFVRIPGGEMQAMTVQSALDALSAHGNRLPVSSRPRG